MRLLARRELELDRVRAELNSRLEAVKAVHERRITSLEAAAARHRDGVERFCREHRDTLMPAGPKSVRTPYGTAGFRQTAPQLLLDEGQDGERACRTLRERKLTQFIRVRDSLDRTALKRALLAGEADEKLLAACGVRLTQGVEAFYCVVEKTQGWGGGGR